MSSRTGVLGDDHINKHCALHRPVPFNRLDLLIPNLKNVSGVYSRKLKDPKVLSRPATPYEMLMELQRLNPSVDIMRRYEAMLMQPAPRIPAPQTPVDVLQREAQPITQQYYIRPNPADVTYLNLAEFQGLLANITEGTSWGGMSGTGGVSTQAPPSVREERPTPSALAEEAKIDDLDEDDLNLQEGLEASGSMDAPRTPVQRMNANREANRSANIDITQAGIINTTPSNVMVLRNRAIQRFVREDTIN